jgi:hypothetical protein
MKKVQRQEEDQRPRQPTKMMCGSSFLRTLL